MRKTVWTFINLLPIVIGMLLLTSLVVTVFPEKLSAGLFGSNDMLDALIDTAVGSVAAGHPLASYLLGGEFLKCGVSLAAVTAFIVSWGTAGSILELCLDRRQAPRSAQIARCNRGLNLRGPVYPSGNILACAGKEFR